MNQSATPIKEYPVEGLMPKQDTQALNFVKRFPQHDGRGTVIAIMDTGVDPGAKGMQVTTDGKPKIIDIIDCTGAGDVVMTKVVKETTGKDKDGKECKVIQGLSGRSLIIDPSWKCPSGDFRVGIKSAYELFPIDLVMRLRPTYKDVMKTKNGQLMSNARQLMAEFDKKNPSPSDNALLQRADLEAQVEALSELEKSYKDPGFVYDCVMFHDGQDWRAVIDVEKSGDLRGQPCLTDYSKEQKYHTFGKIDLLNFSVNIYEDGDILSIVTVSGSHGTHVAGITAGNFPDEPALNGVAPGAQLVSLRIGDRRLISMETGQALNRAASHIALKKIDLANMSYGESSSLPTDGHFIKLMAKEVVSRSGCIFVTSAGNDGPCFSSIGAPAGMDSSFITVGAYVTHAQMKAEYALLESVPEGAFTWSSRGPCTDGYVGVDVYAPGSAVTSIPVYVLTGLDLKNGTSMSSPNACGCIALLVSGLKALGRTYTPFRVKTAVVQSAKAVNDPLGVGFIQVEKAWEYLDASKDRVDLDMQYSVNVNKQGMKRGIYLREHEDTNKVHVLPVIIKPRFVEELDVENPELNRQKFDYEKRVTLTTSQSWIKTTDYVYLHSKGKPFRVEVDPRDLTAGDFHYGEVLGYDTEAPELGPLFRVPVSVSKPVIPCNGSWRFPNIEYTPGYIGRRFVHVPEGASYCELTIRNKSSTHPGPALYMLHLLQLEPQRNHYGKHTYTFEIGDDSADKPNSEGQLIKKRFTVRGGLNMEVCLAQFWSALGKHSVDLELAFHGVQVAGNLANGSGVVHLDAQVTRLAIEAPVRKEENITVGVSFDKVRKHLRPAKTELAPLHPERNTMPGSKLLYALVLSYKLKLDSKTKVNVVLPTVMNQLYEHYLAGVLGMAYDVNNKVVGYMDVVSHSVNLDTPGDYTFVFQLTSEDTEVLEKLKTTVCEIDFDVKSVSFGTYKTIGDVYSAKGSNFTTTTLERNDLVVFHVDASTELPKEAKPGDALLGTLSFTTEKMDGDPYQVVYTVPPAPADEEKPKAEKKPDDAEIEKSLKEAMVELQVKHLKKLSSTSSQFKSVLGALESSYGESPTFLEYKIDTLWDATEGKNAAEWLLSQSLKEEQAREIISLSDKIIKQVNQNDLFAFFGRQKPKVESEAYKEERKAMDKQKKVFTLALKHKLAALAATGQPLTPKFEETYKAFQEVASDDACNDIVFVLCKAQRERKADLPRFGSALKVVQKFLSDASLGPDTAKDIEKAWKMRSQLYRDLQWSLWTEYDATLALIRQPPGGRAPF